MTLKRYVRTRSHPEGSISEGHVFDESLTHCSLHLRGCETRFTRKSRNDDENNLSNEDNIEFFSKNVGRHLSGKCAVTLDHQSWLQAHNYVLYNSDNTELFLK